MREQARRSTKEARDGLERPDRRLDCSSEGLLESVCMRVMRRLCAQHPKSKVGLVREESKMRVVERKHELRDGVYLTYCYAASLS